LPCRIAPLARRASVRADVRRAPASEQAQVAAAEQAQVAPQVPAQEQAAPSVPTQTPKQ
jgi:hypothetical protein